MDPSAAPTASACDRASWGLFALAAAVRLLPLPWRFAQNDELFQLFVATRPSLTEAWAAAAAISPHQPPLDYLLSFLAARFGHDLTLLRLLPAFWGIGSVLIAYRLGTELRGRNLGWFWGLLLALSAMHVEYSQTLRQYSLIVFLMLASTWLHWGVLEGRRRLWQYAAVLSLFGLCYPYALVVAAAQMAFSVRRRGLRGSAECALAAAGAMLPFLFWFAVCGRTVLGGAFVQHPPELQFHAASLWGVLREFSQGSVWVGALFFFLALAGARSGWREAGGREKVLLGGVLLAGIILAAAAAQLNVQYRFRPRHVIAALPVFLGFVAAGLAALLERWDARRGGTPRRDAALRLAALSVGLALLCAGGVLDYLNFQVRAVKRFAAEVAFLRGALGPQDVVVVSYPNAAATLLLAMDPDAFAGLGGTVMRRNAVLFRLRPDLRMGANRLFTLCSLDPESATIDRDGFSALAEEARRGGGKLWLVQGSWNSFPGDEPFRDVLGIPPERMLRRTPAIYGFRG